MRRCLPRRALECRVPSFKKHWQHKGPSTDLLFSCFICLLDSTFLKTCFRMEGAEDGIPFSQAADAGSPLHPSEGRTIMLM